MVEVARPVAGCLVELVSVGAVASATEEAAPLGAAAEAAREAGASMEEETAVAMAVVVAAAKPAAAMAARAGTPTCIAEVCRPEDTAAHTSSVCRCRQGCSRSCRVT